MACSKLAVDKKRKVDFENHEFKSEWTEKYAFVLPAGSRKPMCLICTETVAIIKSGNVKAIMKPSMQILNKITLRTQR